MLAGVRNEFQGEVDDHECRLQEVSSALPQQVVRSFFLWNFLGHLYRRILVSDLRGAGGKIGSHSLFRDKRAPDVCISGSGEPRKGLRKLVLIAAW